MPRLGGMKTPDHAPREVRIPCPNHPTIVLYGGWFCYRCHKGQGQEVSGDGYSAFADRKVR